MSFQVPLYPADDQARLQAVRALGLLDTHPEARFDRLCRLASELLQTPAAYIALLDGQRQWFKATHGMGEVTETPREGTFCDYAIRRSRPTVVLDASSDPLFAHSPYVAGGPRIQFYAGFPLSVEGQRVGTLCALDFQPRTEVDSQHLELFYQLARVAEAELSRSPREEIPHNPGEWSPVTLLIANLRPSATRLEGLSSEQVVDMLKLYLSAIAEVVGRWGGTIERASADSLRVLFIGENDHTIRAASCAVDMRARLEDLNMAFQERELPPLSCGICVHTGEAVLEILGDDKCQNLAIRGEISGLSDRLEALLDDDLTLVTGDVALALGKLAVTGKQVDISLPGLGQPLTLLELDGVGELLVRKPVATEPEEGGKG